MNRLKYTPDNFVLINDVYIRPYSAFCQDCEMLNIVNPLNENLYLLYTPDNGLEYIDTNGMHSPNDNQTNNNMDLIIASVDLFVQEKKKSLTLPITELPKQLRKATTEATITVDGVEYECNINTVMALLGLIRLLEELNDPTYKVQYKGVNGFHERTLEQLKVAGLQVGSYQNKAFAAEKITSEEVANGTITTEEQLKTRFTELMV